MVPPISPQAQPACTHQCVHLVFVPVPGRVVFSVCVLLIISIAVLWLIPLLRKGIKFNEES